MSFDKNNIPHVELPIHPHFIDLTGTKYGRWFVIAYAGRISGNEAQWYCECECGVLRTVRGAALRKGESKSCGCWAVEVTSHLMLTHGMRHTSEYEAYARAKQRCNDPNHDKYPYYGGRGIEFRFTSFQEFYAELGDKPSPKHSIDRYPNNTDGHYETGNVRWATPKQQAGHKRNNHLLTLNGRTQILADWSRELNIPHTTILRRLKRGWSEASALSTPYIPRKALPNAVNEVP